MKKASVIATTPLLTLKIREELDIVAARQRARQIAALLGLASQDQVRLATAVSEVARNAYQYGRDGQVDFSIELNSRPQMLQVTIADNGPGIPDVDTVLADAFESRTGMGIGLAGTRRLMDSFHLDSAPQRGTRVSFGKAIPGSRIIGVADVGRISAQLTQQRSPAALDELQRQNQDLLQALDLLRMRELELDQRQGDLSRLNVELEETNRGVVALYAELDEKAAALQRADQLKSRFLSHVSHEFRTPVNSVLALTALLLRRSDGDLTPEQEKQIGYIRQAVQELAEMVDDLLDLAKVEAGKTEVRTNAVEVTHLFGAIRALMRPLATKETVMLVFNDPAPGLALETDESKLGQILRNLISNALKFTETGEVRVSASLSDDGGTIVFAVRDTGIGVPPEHLDTIFQEFSQIENPLQRGVRGTGLGLPLSRKLAALLGGKLSVESIVGKGSTFTLELPVRPAGPEADAALPDKIAPSKTILIIDDEEASRYIARHLFRNARYRIVESADGIEGAERARFEKPDLIFLDLMMPTRSGFEVLDDLKSDDSSRHIPVVIHTSKRLSENDLARLAARHAVVLPKSGKQRLEALCAIRRILSDPDLFAEEPEFAGPAKRGV
jgi:signal transduction histidine kinase/CheY-like chemotaxis protein